MKKKKERQILVLVWQGCIISFLGVSYVQISETVKHHDKLDEFRLGFVKHCTESQGSCQIMC